MSLCRRPLAWALGATRGSRIGRHAIAVGIKGQELVADLDDGAQRVTLAALEPNSRR
jgi:hypothetical protein